MGGVPSMEAAAAMLKAEENRKIAAWGELQDNLEERLKTFVAVNRWEGLTDKLLSGEGRARRGREKLRCKPWKVVTPHILWWDVGACA